VGSAVLGEGQHKLTFNIRSAHGVLHPREPSGSRTNLSGCMLLGVVDGAADFSASSVAAAWGFNPYSGLQFLSGDVRCWGISQQRICADGLQHGAANGSTVTAEVDLEERSLHFSVNHGQPVKIRMQISKAVRPWCLLYAEGDAVSLTIKRHSWSCRKLK